MEERYRLYSSLAGTESSRVWAEIDTDALRHNYRCLRAIATREDASVRTIAVVKADAYGHGAPACVRALLLEGCDFFAVACIEEALALREICDAEKKDAEILILGYTAPSLASVLAERRLTQALLSESYAVHLDAEARRAGSRIRAHLAVDTGMNRVGLCAHSESEILEAAEAAARINALPCLFLTGAFTHFSRADEESGGEGDACTARQSARYHAWKSAIEARGVQIPFHHICNSASALRRPEDRQNGVRLGIALYGVPPVEAEGCSLESVMRLKTVIAHIHPLLPREGVSYGGEFCSDRERLLATLPVGYADGFLRAYSGASVCVHTANGERYASVVGRICMDQCMIDVTGLDAREGDEVTLIGSQDSLLELARRAKTIPYEVLCSVSARVLRQCRPQ